MNQSNEEEIKCKRCKQIKQLTRKECQDCRKEQKYGRCIECKQINTGHKWCQNCNSKRFQQNFDKWTSDNDNVDNFIQNNQLSAQNQYQLLEWIPYDKFSEIIHVTKGGFGKIDRAIWKDGYISHWDMSKHKWGRCKQNDFVALKSLDNSQNITSEFLNEITLHFNVLKYKLSDYIIRCYGITQDPNTKNYIMVTKYARFGSLRNCLNFSEFQNLGIEYSTKFRILRVTASALYEIHEIGLIHRNLHNGNIVKTLEKFCISDVGLCKPVNYKKLENAESKVYGRLPYMAPEILRGQHYTQASDIYSFGIIMYEVISGLFPYHDIAHHDERLALEICKGLRPKFNIQVPQLILHLIKRCLDADSLNRPLAKELTKIFSEWSKDLSKYINAKNQSELIKTEFIKQIEETKKINDNSSASSLSSDNLIYKMHSESSRLLNFNDLPEPKNSDDYYKNYDNISSMEYSDAPTADSTEFCAVSEY